MQITDISQLEIINKVIPYKDNIDEWYSVGNYFDQIKETCKKDNVNFDNCIIYAVNIFLDESKNKYKNTTPVKCIVKHGSKWVDNTDDYCLLTIHQDLYETYYRFNSIERINDTLKNGWAQDRHATNNNRIEHLHIKLFTTEKDAKDYIKKYKYEHNLQKYSEQLNRINKDLEILQKEKTRLENLINKIKNDSNLGKL